VSLTGIAVIVMCKNPEVGKVKTRLCPPLHLPQAAGVQRVFIQHIARRLEKLKPDKAIFCYDPPDARQDFRDLVRPLCPSSVLLAQASGDTGARIAAAVKNVGQQHHSMLVLSIDSPDVPEKHLDRAAKLLANTAVVLGQTELGGFWGLGLRSQVDADKLLANISWSSGQEARQIIAQANALGYQVGRADAWYDVETADNLNRLRMSLDGSKEPDAADLKRDLASVLPRA
jgi:uncharacterized protein